MHYQGLVEEKRYLPPAIQGEADSQIPALGNREILGKEH